MPIKQHENVLVIYKNPPIYNPQKHKIDKYYKTRRIAKQKGRGQSKAFGIS